MRQSKLYRALLSLGVMSILLPLCWIDVHAASPAKTGVIKVGSSLPLSGPVSAWGNPIAEVATMYSDILNKSGGVTIGDTKYEIKFIVLDDKFTPDGVKASADRLVETEKVNVVVGGWLPPIATIFGRACTAAKIPIIQMVRELPDLEVVSPKYPTMFNLGWPQLTCTVYSVPALKRAVFPKAKTVALLTKDDALGRTMSKIIAGSKDEWKTKYDLEIVYQDVFPITAQDMTPWLAKIAAIPEKVDVIYAASATATNLAMIAKQSHELGLRSPIVSVGSLTDVGAFVETAGEEAAQRVYTGGCAPWEFPKSSPAYKEIANKVREMWKGVHGKDLTYGSAFEWCANQLAAYLNAAKGAGSIQTENIVNFLESKPIEHFYGTSLATGKQEYGINHMLRYDVPIVKVEGRQSKVVVTFDRAPQ